MTLAVIVLPVLAWHGPEPVRVCVDSSAGMFATEVAGAMRAWNEALASTVFSTPPDCARESVRTVTVSVGRTMPYRAWCWFGAPEPLAGDIVIGNHYPWVREGRELLVRVLMHELGHVLGLNHSSDYSSVMFEWVNADAKITEADVRMATAAWLRR